MEKCLVYLNGEDDTCNRQPDGVCRLAINDGIKSGALNDFKVRMTNYTEFHLQGIIEDLGEGGIWYGRCRIAAEIAEAAHEELEARRKQSAIT